MHSSKTITICVIFQFSVPFESLVRSWSHSVRVCRGMTDRRIILAAYFYLVHSSSNLSRSWEVAMREEHPTKLIQLLFNLSLIWLNFNDFFAPGVIKTKSSRTLLMIRGLKISNVIMQCILSFTLFATENRKWNLISYRGAPFLSLIGNEYLSCHKVSMQKQLFPNSFYFFEHCV